MTEPLIGADLASYREGDDDLTVAAALAAARSYCGWHIAPSVTETLTLYPVGGVLILPTLHATAVVVTTADGTVVPAEDYELTPSHISFRGTWYGTGAVTVTLTHGHAELPADLKSAILGNAHSGSFVDGRLKSAGPFSYEFSDADSSTSVLDHYRLAPRP